MKPPFNPFDKEVGDLREDDLKKLIEKQVAEGWYVEYKEAIPINNKIGHSVAAFANSDGGWLIIGVKANDSNVAQEICGIDSSGPENIKDTLRNIISAHISPVPFFESVLIDLSSGKKVLATYIERGMQAPYVTRDGRIYRRVGEGSEPVPETDRYVLEKLFERSSEIKKLIASFCENPFSLSKGQAEKRQCFLEMYFWVSPFGRERFTRFFTKEFFAEIRQTFTSPAKFILDPLTANIDFDGFHAFSGSYILKQVANAGGAENLGLTLEIFPSGSFRMFIPVPTITVDPTEQALPPAYRNSDRYSRLLAMLPQTTRDSIRIIDGYGLFATVTILFTQYYNLLKKYGGADGIRLHFRFSECWCTMVYLDHESFLNYLKDHGLPVCLKPTIDVPEREGMGFPLEPAEHESIGIPSFLLQALGLPLMHLADAMVGFGEYVMAISKSKTLSS